MTQRVADGESESRLTAHHAGPTVAHVVGARPNFMKAAPVMAALRAAGIEQRLIHTGQHYSDALSDVFFRELGLPQPDINLNVGSGSHAAQTANVMLAIEPVLLELRPALLVVYGDVNSTLAATIVASKLLLPVAHVEAGLRSFDRTMPEEINRLVADALADILFVTSPDGEENLRNEGVAAERIHFVGNPMIDTLLANLDRLEPAAIQERLGVQAPYAVVTVHRPANVDDPAAARRVVAMLADLAVALTVVLPLHPRGGDALRAAGLGEIPGLQIVDPLGYLDFISLVRGASVVVTDSGGVQEETTILRVPCLTIRPNTERPITITHGTNRLVAFPDVVPAVREILAGRGPVVRETPPLWDGRAGQRIAAIVAGWLADRGATA